MTQLRSTLLLIYDAEKNTELISVSYAPPAGKIKATISSNSLVVCMVGCIRARCLHWKEIPMAANTTTHHAKEQAWAQAPHLAAGMLPGTALAMVCVRQSLGMPCTPGVTPKVQSALDGTWFTSLLYSNILPEVFAVPGTLPYPWSILSFGFMLRKYHLNNLQCMPYIISDTQNWNPIGNNYFFEWQSHPLGPKDLVMNVT